ncbi:helix-turn-helix transcriptional regulator [Clostridium tertium]|uniref:helix-turn-helix domain-containing protein n=1 Tax=Clostridium tertium TaxID=1559 RepID=UPI00189E18F6|nr:helix-turn-helix transcriptional regulator [Clostridium tertium]MDB1947654.1 helix-turn-helix transcriptional regulator [Clostridium tertium]MDB1956348.1 helix-turn-helix transcriptional regulator [Clostridium tertium]MDB1959644.1 helix-turn-helix transcriptional regulator [Clostridium tertium]MDB1961560.1 helix-turn-helix transcriptional regulator [Clostridium tertium]MDB1967292.1 helix-turn-helix transcriptional regulator [Clostridium tertium]
MYNLGTLLKELRIENKLTQEELANKLNELHDIKLNKGMISKWESNKSEPRFEYVKHLSKLYNVSIDYLLGLTKYKNEEELKKDKEKAIISNLLRNPLGIDGERHLLLKNYNKLNQLGKNEAIKRVEELTYINKYIEEDNKVIEVPKKEKQIWEEPGKEYLMPKASHDKDGEFTEEEYKHDDDLMNNDDLWK